MITTFVGWLQSVGRSLRPWITVKPWEQAVRVRRGKNATLFGPGMYWKFPIIDSATVYAVRTRTAPACLQTLRSFDGRTVTVGVIIRYRISDLLRVLDTLHNPETTLIHMAQGAVSDLVAATNAHDITPERITSAIISSVNPTQFGVDEFAVMVSDNADLTQRTFRLLQEGRWADNASIESMGREA